MARAFDLVIRGGVVVDGTGAERFEADVGVSEGRIAAIGKGLGGGAEEIDARGKLVTPGFVDIHTHYDGQAVWSDRLAPSSSHGVTTAVGGNCGVGFAPCRPEHRELLVSVMEGVEDIPEVVMTAGLTWDWETYPQYLDAIEKRPRDIDFASQIPHSAVRVYVMGERGANREAATADDLEQMQAVVREAIGAGALGFATSRLVIHKTGHGDPIPTYMAAEAEFEAMAMALKDAGRGVLQAVFGTPGRSFEDEIDLLSRLTRMSGRPASFTMVQSNEYPDAFRSVMRHLAEANAAGGPPIRAQVYPRPIGVVLGFDLSANPFSECASWPALAAMPFDQRIAALRDPQVRAQLMSEDPGRAVIPMARLARRFEFIWQLKNPLNYEPSREASLAALAQARGVPPTELAYDMMLENGGRGLLMAALTNYGSRSLDPIRELITDPNAVIGLGDGGAHYGMVCDSSYTTFVLQHWTRERRGERLSLEQGVQALTSAPARTVGLDDRGAITLGRKADFNVIDYDRVALTAPTVVYDLPAGGRRLTQTATGYEALVVSGEVVGRHGEATGKLPGKLVRGQQAAPV